MPWKHTHEHTHTHAHTHTHTQYIYTRRMCVDMDSSLYIYNDIYIIGIYNI